jgi:hypothetical protein
MVYGTLENKPRANFFFSRKGEAGALAPKTKCKWARKNLFRV